MQEPFAPAIAANRFGLGARPGDLERIGGHAPDWLIAQLKGAAPVLTDTGLRSSQDILVETLDVRRAQREAGNKKKRKGAKAGAGDVGSNDADAGAGDAGSADSSARAAVIQKLLKLPQVYRPIYINEATARLRHAATTDRPFVERLTQFWTNHFAVSIDKITVLGLAGAFEREAIRPHVLGNFTDLLLAVEQHPAMLFYLDNYLSVGPNSRLARMAARRQTERKVGINENLAREILELHTLSVTGGYTQQDVTTFAQVLTGWSIGGNFGRLRDGEPGRFTFREALHEPGAKTVLGKRYAEDGESEGKAVLRDVAAKPATATFIATKLARHFIADEPPASAVEKLAKSFTKSHGDLPTVYRTLVELRDSWAQPLAKYKTPTDYIVSSYRALDLPVDTSRRGLASFELLGQRTWSPGSPAGWPDRGADWDGASALMKRIEWADAVGQRVGARQNASDLAPQVLGATLSEETHKAISRAASGTQAVTLLLTAPEFLRR